MITHAMAKEDMTALGKQDPTKQRWTKQTDVSPARSRRSRDAASYDDESKEEITELHNAHKAAGITFARNCNDGLAMDSIALKEMELSAEASRTSAHGGDVDVDEGSHSIDCGPHDFEEGSHATIPFGGHDSYASQTSGLIQATLVDDDPGNIVTAVTGTCGSVPAY
jgi:hypothetical protein